MRIQLCGNLAVKVGGQEVASSLPGRQGRLLLAYLLAHRGQPLRRDELIEVVWQDRLPTAPEASLSSLLTGVRRALGREALSGRSVLTLTLPGDAWVDIDAARSAARAAESALAGGEPHEALERGRAALELVGQPVLAEFEGDWVEQLRGDVNQLRCDQLETAARAALALGEAENATAQRLARSLIELEPYRESGYAVLMEALAAGGNVAAALLVYDELRVRLREELGVAPAAGLTALHERLLVQGEVAPPAPAPAASGPPAPPLPGMMLRSEQRPFVARERELARLQARWEQVRTGHGELVVITGEPGIGKTRLAARIAAEAHASGAAVAYGRADEETVVPYQPFVEALRHLAADVDGAELARALGALAAELRPLMPELGRAGGGEPAPENTRYALFEAVSALLEHCARQRPLLLVLDDLHWADKPTLLLLREVVRRAESSPLLVLGSYRDVELSPGAPLLRVLADLRREQVLHRVSLAGFDERETAALVAARAEEALGPGYPRRLREYTDGNPFFIEETLRSLGEAQLPDLPGPVGALRVPESVQDMIVRRFERLASPTRETLTCAAVLGREFSLATLEQIVEQSGDEALVSLEEAVDAGLAIEHSEPAGRFAFSHALVRETIYAAPAASRRQRLHLRAGEALERDPAAAAELAHHFFLSRHAGGAERAVAYAAEAAREAARAHAYEEAAGHDERALEALELMPGEEAARRTEILLHLGAMRWRGGEPGARAAFDEAAQLARSRADTAALVRAALGAGGRFYAPGSTDPSYVALLEEALGCPEASGGAVRARLLARLAEALAGGAADERPDERSREAVRVARAAGDPAGLVAALRSRHAALLGARHLDERTRVGEEAVALADRHDLRELSALGRHWLIYDLMEAGELERAVRRHAELERLAGELRQPLYRHSTLAWRGVWAQLAGRFDEAERLAREGLRLAERARARDAHAHFTAQLLGVRREQGRLAELLPAIERLAAEGSEVLAWRALLPLALLESGAREAAATELAANVRDDFRALPAGMFWLPAAAWLAEAAAELGNGAASTALHAQLEPHAGRLVQAGFTGCWGAVDRFVGLLAGAAGRPDEARERLASALERHRALAAVPLIARTRRDLERHTASSA